VISGFHCDVDVNCVFLGHYAAPNGNSSPAFHDNVLVPSSRVTLEDGTDMLSQNVSKDYHWMLHNTLEQGSPHTILGS
jgi:hypothetical protein